jgi:phosphatidylserine/phosphatidylglycerophosphate/cardiolipin synthase-like enzyme
MARERLASKPASRRQALRRFRARGAWLYATLLPRAGRVLPNELRAEKVGHLAEALPLGVRDAGFERLVGRVDTGPIHHGNHVQLFFRGEEAFASVRQAIEGSSNLDFRSFYFNAECNVLILDDATGRTMAQAFEKDLGQSLEMRLENWNRRPLAHRCGDALARCLSPLL